MVRLPQMGHSRGSSRSGIAPVPASVLLSASGSAIKRIKAGVKACLSTAPCQVMDSLEGLHPPGKSITNEKRILLSDASRARLYGLAGITGLRGSLAVRRTLSRCQTIRSKLTSRRNRLILVSDGSPKQANRYAVPVATIGANEPNPLEGHGTGDRRAAYGPLNGIPLQTASVPPARIARSGVPIKGKDYLRPWLLLASAR